MGSRRAAPLVDADRSTRVAVLASKSAARLRYLVTEDPNCGEAYDVVGGVVTAADSDAESVFADNHVPVETTDIQEFYAAEGAPLSDMDLRREFDAHLAETLASYDPDLVVLSGYLYVVTDPVLDRFFPRIVSAHHGDLTVRDESGEPVYTGLDAVEDAIRAGEASTHETTHLVTEGVDRGPVVTRSRPFPIHRRLVADTGDGRAQDVLDAYVYAHREWMIREGGGPTLAKTIELVANGRVGYDPERGVTLIDDRRGYYQMGADVVATEQTGGDSESVE